MVPSKSRFVSFLVMTLFALMAMSSGQSSTSIRADDQDSAKLEGKDTRLKDLQKERLAAARDCVKLTKERVKNNSGMIEEMIEPTRTLLEAELDVCASKKERIAVLEKILVEAKWTEELAERLAKTGQGRQGTASLTKAERLRIEIALERAKTKDAGKPAEGRADQDLRDQAALAEKQAAVKRAAVKVAEAQQEKARASLNTIRAQVGQAKAGESYAEAKHRRIEELFKRQAVDQALLDEAKSHLDTAKAKLGAADSAVAEAEAQVAIEQARVLQAQLEFEEADLRAKQLQARVRPSR